MSNKLMILLTIIYVVLMICAATEKRWGLLLYWLGATILNSGLLIGMK